MGGAHATTDRFDTFVEQLAAPAPRRRVLLGLGGLTWALRDDWRRTSRQRPRIVTSGAAASARTGSQSARTAAWIAAPITNEPAALRHDQGTNRHEGWSEGGCAHTTSAVPGDRPTRGHVLNRTSPFSSSRSPSNDQRVETIEIVLLRTDPMPQTRCRPAERHFAVTVRKSSDRYSAGVGPGWTATPIRAKARGAPFGHGQPSDPRSPILPLHRSHLFTVVWRASPADEPIVLRSAADSNLATMAFHEELARLSRQEATGELVMRNHDPARTAAPQEPRRVSTVVAPSAEESSGLGLH
jgi:hypothetical protein